MSISVQANRLQPPSNKLHIKMNYIANSQSKYADEPGTLMLSLRVNKNGYRNFEKLRRKKMTTIIFII